MKRIILTSILAVFALSQGSTLGQSGPKEVTFIKDAQIKAVMRHGTGDQTVQVVDMGKYQLSIAMVQRGPSSIPNKTPVPANPTKCGLPSAPPGAKLTPGMISHDQTAETYIVTSGSGTLVTGGEFVDGNRSEPDSNVTKILNGPSCTGRVTGNIVTRPMSVGDIAIIPPGVPHGWIDIVDHVDYLSVRSDPDKVLQHGYMNPHMNDTN